LIRTPNWRVRERSGVSRGTARRGAAVPPC
jgi:hypothetical protein